MVLNDAGKMIDQVCQEIPKVLQGVELDHYQIMPNHFHGIIVLNPIEIGVASESTVGATLCEALFELWPVPARVLPCPTRRALRRECYARQTLPPFGGLRQVCPYTKFDCII